MKNLANADELSEESSSKISRISSIPEDLSPGQKAQLCEILDYLQTRLHKLIESSRTDEANQEVILKMSAWQRLLDTQMRSAWSWLLPS